MNFRFQNLLAAPYRGGNVKVTADNTLLSPIGNRISATDLTKSQTITLPFQLSSNISRIAVTSNNQFLLAVDSAGRASFINVHTRTVLHRITFKSPVTAVEFSPDGKFIAVGLDRAVQVWSSPGFKKEFFSFHLVRNFHESGDNVTCIDWSRDSMHLVVGSKDLTVRIYCVDKSKGPSKPFVMMGHRESVVGVYFVYARGSGEVNGVYSISKDGTIFTWALASEEGEGSLNARKWELVKKDFFMQSPARLTACDYHSELDMVVVAFSDGVFGLYQMPDFVCIHKLSISRQKITTAVFNKSGNWLTFGCAKLGQLLVWEWRTESYILKQQGHYFDVNCVSYSPDSQMIATGADDNKIKVWTVSSGFCFVTFSEHTNAVTSLHFMANNNCLLSASLDGTVRAWDLFRYRNFRIFTTPTPRQFVALTADQSGEIICAGTLDSFEIYVWSMKTGRLLDILSGHEGPVHGLMFSPTNAILASSSWDKTVRLWDVFEGKGAVESFPHTHDVLTLVYRPDGKQLACSTLDGQIHFWDPIDGVAMYTIEGRRDISGGRLMTDRRSALNSTSGKYFTTLCYSADGSYILAGGNSKFICMYDITDQVLLRKFQITRNLSLDGVLDFLNGKNMTEAGPLDLIDDVDSDVEDGIDKQTYSSLGYNLPGAKPNRGRPIVRTKCLKIAPTGRSWAAATTEGVMMYSVDDSFVFDPTDLDIDVTPEAVDVALAEDQHQRALLISLRLNEDSLIKKCIFAVNPLDISAVALSIPIKYIQRLVEAFADLLENCPHLEFCLQWCQELCKAHGQFIHQNSRSLLPALKSLQKSITKMHQDLSDICSSNEYMLKYLCSTEAAI